MWVTKKQNSIRTEGSIILLIMLDEWMVGWMDLKLVKELSRFDKLVTHKIPHGNYTDSPRGPRFQGIHQGKAIVCICLNLDWNLRK